MGVREKHCYSVIFTKVHLQNKMGEAQISHKPGSHQNELTRSVPAKQSKRNDIDYTEEWMTCCAN